MCAPSTKKSHKRFDPNTAFHREENWGFRKKWFKEAPREGEKPDPRGWLLAPGPHSMLFVCW